jgi:hypothetical protein
MPVLVKAVATAAALAALGLATACDGDHACPMLRVTPGVSLAIEPPYSAQVARASLTVCPGACRPTGVVLLPSPRSCPDGPCPSATPAEGLSGSVRVPGLRKEPVRVTVELWNSSGDRILADGITVTPVGIPHCDIGLRAQVTVVKGHLRPR